jgi:hypothetical protein
VKRDGPEKVYNEFLKKDRSADRRLTNLETQEPFLRLRHKNITAADSPYTAGREDVIYADDSLGAITINLPDAASYVGKTYTVKKMANVVAGVTLDGFGAQVIDTALTYGLTTYLETVTIHSDGGNWWVLGRRV